MTSTAMTSVKTHAVDSDKSFLVWVTPVGPFCSFGRSRFYERCCRPSQYDQRHFSSAASSSTREIRYSPECVPGAFKLDTRLDGNRNTGHVFGDGPLGNGVIGRALDADERWAVIEYLKSL